MPRKWQQSSWLDKLYDSVDIPLKGVGMEAHIMAPPEVSAAEGHDSTSLSVFGDDDSNGGDDDNNASNDQVTMVTIMSMISFWTQALMWGFKLKESLWMPQNFEELTLNSQWYHYYMTKYAGWITQQFFSYGVHNKLNMEDKNYSR